MLLIKHVQDQKHPVIEEIESHPAWCGNITGLEAESLLRGTRPFTFVLREGEKPLNYYVTFVQEDGFMKHQPVLIMFVADKWCYLNGGKGVPTELPFATFIHKIIHCEPQESRPLVKR